MQFTGSWNFLSIECSRRCMTSVNVFSFLLINQVSLKSPDVLLTLPIYIGNVSLDKKKRSSRKEVPSSSAAAGDTLVSVTSPGTSPYAAKPTLPAHPAPEHSLPQSRKSVNNYPSAPVAEFYQEPESGTNHGHPNKRQSQPVSCNAFSYAPGLSFFNDKQRSGREPLCGASNTITSAPFLTESDILSSVDYSSAEYPQGQLVLYEKAQIPSK